MGLIVHEYLEQLHVDDLGEWEFKVDYGTTKHEEPRKFYRVTGRKYNSLMVLDFVVVNDSGRDSEVLFSEEFALSLKKVVGSKEYKLGLLRTELEKVKQETEGVNFKIAKFDKSTKDLNEMLEKFKLTNSKKGSKKVRKINDDSNYEDYLWVSDDENKMGLRLSTVKRCLLAVKRIFRYLKGKPSLGLWYSKDSPLELVAYTDSDYAGATQDRKSTTGGCQFLGNRLISWQCKKQTVVATSTTEAEYVAAASCCGQVLWIQNQLLDYGYNFMNTVIYIDNNSTICIIENPVQHSKTKHIEIRHHFIRDCNAKKLIQMVKIDTEHNVADLLTKGFDAGRFQYLVSSIGMLNP
ncbi:hypothetical protein Tco_0374804 [Tanacetum coccineum]